MTLIADDAPHILIVDDDAPIRSLLKRFLEGNGYRTTTAENAQKARLFLSGLVFDLLIIDVMMPGESGVDLTKGLRDKEDVPIIMLTARSEIEDRIKGLEVGADDYVAKPFEPRELLLRIQSILRRGRPEHQDIFEDVRFGPFIFNLPRSELKRGGETIRLTDRETAMLSILARKPGQTVARHELIHEETGDRTVDVHMNRLRRKIEEDPANPAFLQTVRGQGYRLLSE